jgi:hypothetical protein
VKLAILGAVTGSLFLEENGMKNIGLTATQALTPKGKPSAKLHAGGMGHSSLGTKSTVVMRLKAGNMGHKSQRRNPKAVTGLRAPK